MCSGSGGGVWQCQPSANFSCGREAAPCKRGHKQIISGEVGRKVTNYCFTDPPGSERGQKRKASGTLICFIQASYCLFTPSVIQVLIVALPLLHRMIDNCSDLLRKSKSTSVFNNLRKTRKAFCDRG